MRIQINKLATCASLVSALAVCGTAAGKPVGMVTVMSDDGVTIVHDGQPTLLDPLKIRLRDREVEIGDAVATTASGTAVVHFSSYGTVAALQSASKLLLEKPGSGANDLALALRLAQGSVLVTRKSSESGPVALVGENGQAVGYVLLSEGVVLVSIEGPNVVFTALAGEASYFEGAVGGKAAADGRRVNEGQQVSVTSGPAPADTSAARALWKDTGDRAFTFGLKRSDDWVQRAEEGDFTPVRSSESRAEPELVGTEFIPPQAFDQPTQLAAVTTPQQVGVQSLRTVVSPAQGLVQSGIPGSVIAGQRFRRSVIIGNPGTTGSGAITINPSAELLIRLAGQ